MSVGVVRTPYPEAVLTEILGIVIKTAMSENPVFGEKLRANLMPLAESYITGSGDKANAGLAVMGELRRIVPSAIPDTSGA